MRERERGNIDGARTYAENAICKRNEQMNYLHLASHLNVVVARLDTQAKMATITKSMGTSSILSNLLFLLAFLGLALEGFGFEFQLV
jgi:hypothetical protein